MHIKKLDITISSYWKLLVVYHVKAHPINPIFKAKKFKINETWLLGSLRSLTILVEI